MMAGCFLDNNYPVFLRAEIKNFEPITLNGMLIYDSLGFTSQKAYFLTLQLIWDTNTVKEYKILDTYSWILT